MNWSHLVSLTQPSCLPTSVSRMSALSSRSDSRYSARLVNIRYGLGHAAIDTKSVGQHTEVGLVAPREQVSRRSAPGGVEPCQQALRCCLLVSGGAVDLPAKNKMAIALFPASTAGERIIVVVLDARRASDMRLFKGTDAVDQLQLLHIERAAKSRFRSDRSRWSKGPRAPGRSGASP